MLAGRGWRCGEGRDGEAVSLLGYRVGGDRFLKPSWSPTLGRRSRKLGFDAVGGVNYEKRGVSV